MLLLKMWPKRSRSNCCPKWHSLKRCPKCQYLNCPPKWCCSQRFKNAFARNLSWNIAQNYITQNVTQNVVVENRIAKNVAQNVSQNVIIQMSLLKMPLFEMSPKSLIFGCEKKVEHFGIRNVPYLTLVLFFLLSSHFRPLSSSRLHRRSPRWRRCCGDVTAWKGLRQSTVSPQNSHHSSAPGIDAVELFLLQPMPHLFVKIGFILMHHLRHLKCWINNNFGILILRFRPLLVFWILHFNKKLFP